MDLASIVMTVSETKVSRCQWSMGDQKLCSMFPKCCFIVSIYSTKFGYMTAWTWWRSTFSYHSLLSEKTILFPRMVWSYGLCLWKSSVEKMKIEECSLYHSLMSTRDEKSVLQTTFHDLVAQENQMNVCFIYLISWILYKSSPVADCDRPSEISS